MRIPGYGRSIKWIICKVADSNKTSFLKELKKIYKANKKTEKVPMEVISFSGTKAYADQCYSILSFLKNVGEPIHWTIYSDGTYTQEEIELLQSLSWISVIPYNKNIDQAPEVLIRFADKYVWGKRLIAYVTHPIKTTTIFTDSDILFYPEFKRVIPSIQKGNWFIDDTGPHFDSYYMNNGYAVAAPFLNAGFLIFNDTPNWNVLLNYINDRLKDGNVEHYTDQTAFHKMVVETGLGTPLSNNLFILSCSDHFTHRVHFNVDKIALRHFVSPVRHKMWQTHWKKVLVRNENNSLS